MQQTTNPAPTIHRAATPADFVAVVPTLLGFHPEQSVVLVPFGGRGSLGAARFDLPRGDPSVPAELIVATMAQHVVADSVRVVVYSRGALPESGPLPEAALVRVLLRTLNARGFEAHEAWLVAADGWIGYSEPNERRRGLEELANAAARLAPGAPVIRSVAERATLPELDPAEVTAVRVEVDALLDRHPDAELLETDRIRALTAIRRVANGGVLPSAAVLARIVVLVQRQDRRRDVLLAAVWAGDHRARARMARPPVQRMERVIALAGHVAACAAESEAAGTLAFLAIVHWAFGQGSVAGVLIDRALQSAPRDPDLRALWQTLSDGAVPPWVRLSEDADAAAG
ncbi:DUF4192 family protein [Microbacteriaceae bacterium VKM Ac-2854]|nr:DUF4192 family protein [Microbacteriaceae bacterium VKM Ac-2854]